MGRLRVLTGEPWLFWLLTAMALNQAAANMLRPMVSYRALELGVDPAGLGILSAVFNFAPLVIALPIGRALDRPREMRFIVAGNVLMGVSGLALAAMSDATSLFVLFGVMGVGHFVAAFSVQPLVARFSHHGNYDRRFAAYSFAASVGQLLGPAIGGLVAGGGSHDEIGRTIILGGILALVLLIPLALVRPPATTRPAAGSASPGDRTAAAGGSAAASSAAASSAAAGSAAGPGPVRRLSLMEILRMPDVARAILVSTTVLSAIDIVIIYLPALGEERAWAASLVGGLLALRAGSSMATRLILGWLAARFERRTILIWSMGISAASLLALPIAGPVPLIALLMIGAGAGLGIGQPLTMAWVAALAPAGVRATLLSVRVMGNSVGEVLLPVAAGSVAAIGGAAGVLAATGAIVAISLAWGFAGKPGAGRVHA
jgi:MFS family permease